MQVHEVMTEPPQTCPRTMHLSEACRRMRDSGCGSLVVLGARGRIVGIVTDRDLALALGGASRRRAPHCGSGHVTARSHVPARRRCDRDPRADDHRPRSPTSRCRRDGDVKGVISIDDIVLWGLQSSGVSMRALIAALRSLCAASGFAAREYAEGNRQS